MVGIDSLLDALAHDGFVLEARDGRLICHGPHGRRLDDSLAAALRPRRAELIRHLTLARRRAQRLAPIQATPRGEDSPLSPAQRRLWFLETYAGGSTGAYHVPTHLRLTGTLDVAALRRSLTELVRRHDILRSVFVEADGEPIQRVLPPRPADLPVTDLEAADVDRAIRAEAAAPFDLRRDLPWRARLWRVSATEHHLLLVQHHIVTDGRSIELYVRELAALYADAHAGRAFSVPAPTLQYADYVAWQRHNADPELADAQCSWWASALAGCEPLALILDGQRPAAPAFRGAQHHARLPAATVRAVETLARERRTTPFAVLLAAFQTLLHFWSGQDDVTIVTGVSGRDHPDLTDLPGFFINLVPIRTRFAADPCFADVVEDVSGFLDEALARQDVPLERLLRAAGFAAEGASSPLLRVMLVMQAASGIAAPAMPGLAVTVTPEADQDIAKADLTLSLQSAGDAIELRIEYDTDLFRRETIACLGAQFAELLDRVTRDPTAPPRASALLTATGFRRFVLDANRTEVAYPRGAGLARLFAEQVARTPDATAIVDGERALSYRELDEEALRLASRLRARLQPGRAGFPSVAVCMERRLELAVAVLAIVRAGAAYVPLDPHYPESRLRYLLDEVDAAATLVCGLEEATSRALQRTGRPVVSLDDLPPAGADAPAEVDPTIPAYVCFTSGTTGAPKGVVIEQDAVARLVLNADYVRFAPGMRVGLISNPVFDALTFEFWGALLNGGTLFVFSRDIVLDADAFAGQLDRERIETIFLTTALFDAFARHRPAMFRHLRYLVVGGSALTPATVAAVLHCAEGRPRHLVNGYGPTENTTFSVCHEVAGADCGRRAIPIGRPIANSTAYVLDPDGRALPPCMPGELWVGGDGLGRGYLNQTALTAERFVFRTLSHPDVPAQAARLYRTGDIVRRLPDGALDYVGRRDRQVKVNGFRVEPGEIEARIAAHPDMRQCAVRPVEADGHKRLVAWYATRDGADVPEGALRHWLEQALPPYMVPALLLRRQHLPTTPGGKIDLDALRVPDLAAIAAPPALPGDAVAKLIAIWRDVLRVDAIGPDDDFFVIGGDSILSIQVVARARQGGLSLAPRMIFEHRTPRRIAAAAEATRAASPRTHARGEVALTPIQRWFFELGLAQPAHFNQAFLLMPPEPVGREALANAVRALLERHPVLGTRFRRDPAGDWQPVAGPAVPPQIHETILAADADLQAVLTGWQSAFSLEEGRLLVAGLVGGHPDGRQRVFLAVHHLVVDIVSWRVLFDDLFQLLADPATPLPAPSAPFAHWSGALADFAAGAAQDARDHWLGFAAAEAEDCVAGPVRTRVVRLDPAATDDLLRRAGRGFGTRPHELLLTATAMALHACGEAPAAIWLEGHGREDVVGPEVARTVGWFTSRFPFRLPAPAGWTDAALEDLLVATKEALRGVPHHGLSFGVLRDLAPDQAMRKALRRVDVAPVTFNYLGQFDAMLGGGWRIAPEAPGEMVSAVNRPTATLDVSALVVDGCLELRAAGAADRFPIDRLDVFTAAFLAAAGRLIALCTQRRTVRLTPSDFPDAGLTAEELTRVCGDAEAQPAAIYRLTPLQEGLLFHALHRPASDQYVVQFAWSLLGPIDAALLQRAWQETAAAQDALRTRFAWAGLRHPVQVVERDVRIEWQEADLALDAAASSSRLPALKQAERARGFDLAAAAPWRVLLARLGDARFALIWTHHHILLDGWSAAALIKEVAARYQALLDGRAADLPGAPAFGAYVSWLLRQDRASAIAWWRGTLAGITAPTDVPVRRPGAQLAAHAAIAELGTCRLELDAAPTRKLEKTARQAGATLNAAVQLAWALVLQRYSGHDEDVVFGTVVSGRANDFAGAERVVGLAANVVPLRAELADDDPPAAALAAMHRLVEDAALHSHVSLADIQSATAVPAGTPLIHTATAFENYPEVATAANALHAVAGDVEDKTNFPLMLLALPGDALRLRLQYDAGVFDADAMAAMLGHVAQALHGLAEAPETLGDIAIVTESARLRELALASGEVVPPVAATVVSLFRTRALERGSAVAVEAEEGSLSYGELWAAAERLAGVLRARHRAVHGCALAPDTRIGLCLERGLGMSVAVWGVLLAGAAYVPLDPEYPQDRLEFLISDSACGLIVCTSALAGRLGSEAAARTVPLEGHLPAADAMAEAPPAGWAGPAASDLAYVIYTSGSTGRPKGAMIEHRSLVNRIAWMRAAYGLGPADRVLQKTPFSFDVSVWELVLPVVSGAPMVFARPGGHREPAYLADLIARRGITVLHFVPSMLRVFLEAVDARRLEGLRLVFCSGEALAGDLAGRLLAALPRVGLHNLYGPTEAAVDVSFHRCAPDEAGAVVPIGRPVWNTQLHVLDQRMRPAPGGVPGELWIGGVQVGRGYLNRDALTAERFVEGCSGEGRLYRTGDRVRRRADGVLEYLGRTDFQLKLRGYRIEPGEIEAALETVPGVRQACVVARDLGGEMALVGYIAAGDAPADGELRRVLAALLPHYMIPARFVRLAALPLNTAGKVDRHQLPEPARDAAPTARRQPGNALEAAIAEIAADVLDRDVGVDEDLFALGAHSLHVVRIAARLSQRLGREVPLSAVFEDRTAARLAASLAGGGGAADTVTVLDRTETLRPSAAQERLWFLDRLVADPATYNVPYALRLRGRFSTEAWQAAVDRVVAAHEILRSNIVAEDGMPALVVHADRRITVIAEKTDAARLPDRLRSLARKSFDLARDALLRVHVLEVGAEEHVLFLNQHHLVTDGWSVGVLLRQLAVAYADALHGRTGAPPAALQYADLAAWQRARLNDAREALLLDFWRAELADLPLLELPADRPRPAVMSYRGAVHRFAIDAADAALLHALSRRCGATLFATLLAGFNLLLTRWTGQDDIVVGTPVANRQHAAQEDALGLFANTIVLRNRIDRDRTVAETITSVAGRTVRALSHQDMPFERLVEALGVARDTGRTPLFQIFFILQNAGGAVDLALPGLTVEPLPLDTGTAKFDLTLSLEERDGALSGVIEYATDLFDASTIVLIGGAYRALLAGMAASPDRAARELVPVSVAAESTPPRHAGAHVSRQEPRQAAIPRAVPADAPRTATERLVGEIWREVLGIDAVPAHTSFFELGGSSLGLMRVQARLGRALQRDVPMMELFAHPTVARLAAWLDGAPDRQHSAAQPPRPIRTVRGPRARPLG